MQLFCPTCQAAFAGLTHCPRCAGRLLSPQESFVVSGPARSLGVEAVRPTLGGRVLIGTLVAVGTAVGLCDLAAPLVPSDADWWRSAAGWPAAVVVRLLAVLAGAAVAGAGRSPGWALGAAVGLIVGGLFAAADGPQPTPWAFGAIAGLAVVGAVAGAVGVRVWPPDVPLPEPTLPGSQGSSLITLAAEDRLRRTARPTVWPRVLCGAAVAVVGVLASDDIRLWLARSSGGVLNTGGMGVSRARAVGLPLATLFLAAGGAVAGAGTGAGLRHGLFAGVLAATAILVGTGVKGVASYPSADGFLELLGVEPGKLLAAGPGAAVGFAVLLFVGASGWLGGQLFPPLARNRRRRLTQQS